MTKAEIGVIKINDRDTRFQIVAEVADTFADAARTNKTKEGHISRVGANTPADDAAVLEAIDALAPPNIAKPYKSFDGAPRGDAPPKVRTKERWRDRDKAKLGGHGVRIGNGPTVPNATEPAASPEAAPYRDAPPRPHAKAPWQDRDRSKSKPGGEFHRKSERAGSAVASAPNAAANGDTASRPHSKAPWQDRSKGKAGGHPARAGAGAGPQKSHPRAAPHLGHPQSHVGAPMPKSKYAHKKKHRKGAPAGS